MIRRIIWLLIILGLAYGIYHWIDPVGAQELVVQIQSYFQKDSTLVSDDGQIDQEELEEAIEEDVVVTTGFIENQAYTGTIDTDFLVELDYILSEPSTTGTIATTGMTSTTGTAATTGSATTTTQQSTTTNTQPKPTTTTRSLSERDKQDIKNLLNAIVE